MIRPLPGFVLLEPIEDEDKSAGGVYLPETSKEKPSKGKIVSVGEAILTDTVIQASDEGMARFVLIAKSGIKRGDVVVYKRWTNQEVTHNGKTYLIVHFNELLAIEE